MNDNKLTLQEFFSTPKFIKHLNKYPKDRVYERIIEISEVDLNDIEV